MFSLRAPGAYFSTPISCDSAPCDPLVVVSTLTSYSLSAQAAWAETLAHLKRLDLLTARSHQASWMRGWLQAQLSRAPGVCCSTCPFSVELRDVPLNNCLDIAWGGYAESRERRACLLLLLCLLQHCYFASLATCFGFFFLLPLFIGEDGFVNRRSDLPSLYLYCGFFERSERPRC